MARRKSSRQLASALLILALLALALGPCSACLDHPSLRQQMSTRIQGHQQLTEFMKDAEAAAAAAPQAPAAAAAAAAEHEHDAARASRMLQAVPAPIRILPEFQLSSSLSASTQATIRAVVNSAITSLQGYIQVRSPVGTGGLLAIPQIVSTGLCNTVNANPGAYGGQTCSGPGWYPSFGSNLPVTDIKYPLCGPGVINPAHVLSTSCINTQNGAITCRNSASGASGGLQTDMYIYVTSDQASCPTNVAAYALPCFYDLTTNRPIMGALNLCAIATSGYTTDKLLATVTHELTHALGFTNDLFKFYINPSTNAVLGESNVVFAAPATGSSILRNNYSMVITPTVLQEVRSQYSCPGLNGAALEDQGGSGSANSHWEYELFQGDLMTPTKPADSGSQRISRLTLALMEDSGWYVGNWTAAAPLDWGRKAGCNMAQQTCSAYQTNTPGQPFFCSNPGTNIDTCSFNGISHGYCSTNPTFARCGIVNTLIASGTSNPAVVQPSCTSSSYTNAGAGNEPDGTVAFGWSIGGSSRCLSTSLPLSSTNPPLYLTAGSITTLGICWTASCDSSDNLLYNVAGRIITCNPGTSIALSALSPNYQNGVITCPKSTQQVQAICRTLQCPATGCNNPGGSCFEGKCVCRLGNTGADCSNDLLQIALSGPSGSSTAPGSPGTAPGTSPASTSGPNNQGGGPLGPSAPSLTGQTSTSTAAQTGSSGLSGTTLMIVIIVASVVGAIIVISVIGIIIAASSGSKVNPATATPSTTTPQQPPGAPHPQPGAAGPPALYPSYAPPGYAQPGYNAAPQQAYYPPPGYGGPPQGYANYQ